MAQNRGSQAHDVEFRRLYLIAKAIILADPYLDNGEWCDRIKDQLIAARLGYPERPDQIHDVMRAVEGVVTRTPPKPTPVAATQPVDHTADVPHGDRERFARFMDHVRRVMQSKHLDPTSLPNQTADQIAAWRMDQHHQRTATHRLTARGWVPIHGDE